VGVATAAATVFAAVGAVVVSAAMVAAAAVVTAAYVKRHFYQPATCNTHSSTGRLQQAA